MARPLREEFFCRKKIVFWDISPTRPKGWGRKTKKKYIWCSLSFTRKCYMLLNYNLFRRNSRHLICESTGKEENVTALGPTLTTFSV